MDMVQEPKTKKIPDILEPAPVNRYGLQVGWEIRASFMRYRPNFQIEDYGLAQEVAQLCMENRQLNEPEIKMLVQQLRGKRAKQNQTQSTPEKARTTWEPLVDYVFPYLNLQQLAVFSMASRKSCKTAGALHRVTEHTVNQHCWGFGAKRQMTSSCTMVALSAIAHFRADAPSAWQAFLEQSSETVQNLYRTAARKMGLFTEKVLRPVAPATVLEAMARPDEVLANLWQLGPEFNDYNTCFKGHLFWQIMASAPLKSTLDAVQAFAVNQLRDGTAQTVECILCLDGKSSALLFRDQGWLSLDSHQRSKSGHPIGTTSLAATGRLDGLLSRTLGELMVRGGQDAAYTWQSFGGAWILLACPAGIAKSGVDEAGRASPSSEKALAEISSNQAPAGESKSNLAAGHSCGTSNPHHGENVEQATRQQLETSVEAMTSEPSHQALVVKGAAPHTMAANPGQTDTTIQESGANKSHGESGAQAIVLGCPPGALAVEGLKVPAWDRASNVTMASGESPFENKIVDNAVATDLQSEEVMAENSGADRMCGASIGPATGQGLTSQPSAVASPPQLLASGLATGPADFGARVASGPLPKSIESVCLEAAALRRGRSHADTGMTIAPGESPIENKIVHNAAATDLKSEEAIVESSGADRMCGASIGLAIGQGLISQPSAVASPPQLVASAMATGPADCGARVASGPLPKGIESICMQAAALRRGGSHADTGIGHLPPSQLLPLHCTETTPIKAGKAGQAGDNLTPPPPSGSKRRPACTYSNFQRGHKGVWRGKQRCPWPEGTPGCRSCVALLVADPSLEAQQPSMETHAAPQEPQQQQVVPSSEAGKASGQKPITSGKLVSNFIAEPCRAGIYSILPREGPHGASRQKFPLWCSRCRCTIDCLSSKSLGVQKIIQHEGYNKHKFSRPYPEQVCSGQTFRLGESYDGKGFLLSRLVNSLCTFQPFVSPNSSFVVSLVGEGGPGCEPEAAGIVKIQSRLCAPGKQLVHGKHRLCQHCHAVVRDPRVADKVAKFSMKVDELEYLCLLCDGDQVKLEEFLDGLRVRDYVLEGRAGDIFEVTCMELAEAAAHVLPKFEAVPQVYRNPAYAILLEKAKLVCDGCTGSPARRASQALAQSLSAEVASGQISCSELHKGIELASGKLRRDDLILGLLEASLSEQTRGKGWQYMRRKPDPEQRWRLRSAALRLSSMGISNRGLRDLNLIVADKNLWTDCPQMPNKGFAKPFLAIQSPDVLLENYGVGARKLAGVSVPGSAVSPTSLYLVFDEAYVKRCSDLMPAGLVAAYQDKGGVCGGKWSLVHSEDKSYYAADKATVSEEGGLDKGSPPNLPSWGPRHSAPWTHQMYTTYI